MEDLEEEEEEAEGFEACVQKLLLLVFKNRIHLDEPWVAGVFVAQRMMMKRWMDGDDR